MPPSSVPSSPDRPETTGWISTKWLVVVSLLVILGSWGIRLAGTHSDSSEARAGQSASPSKAQTSRSWQEIVFQVAGQAYLKTHQWDQAALQFDRIISLRPNFAEAYAYRGQAHLYMNQWDKAINDFTEAIRLDPNSPLAYQFRGEMMYKLGALESALQDFKRALEREPRLARAYAFRGLVYESQGNTSQAQAGFQKAKELDPELDIRKEVQ